MKPEIITLRKQLDTLDQELLALLIKRLNIVTDIAKIKKELCLPIFDPNREKEIIFSLIEKTTEEKYKHFIEPFFKEIFRISKEWQAWIVMD
jgi:monofunctional chorismate mutase